ncbi:MAG: ATP-binding protein [Bifidobacteriaceae bacterium]|nr:ATP-binding protein [Bifidobacteriaceae bacterium]
MSTEPAAAGEVDLPEWLAGALESRLREGEAESFSPPSGGASIVAAREGGRIVLYKQVARHLATTGESVAFDVDDESEGSKRLIDLLPCLIRLAQPGAEQVLVIDELDRSLHTLLIRRLLEWYLASRTPEGRSQLLFTTHDLLLMDQRLFRRDEMWVTERDSSGASSLFALSDYQDTRYDKDIRKSYLQGRLGGIPRILLEPAPSAANG